VREPASGKIAAGVASAAAEVADGAADGFPAAAIIPRAAADGSTCRGAHDDGALVEDYEYFEKFFLRFNKVLRPPPLLAVAPSCRWVPSCIGGDPPIVCNVAWHSAPTHGMASCWTERVMQVLLDTTAVDRERKRLEQENEDLRTILKQYLDGISVNADVMNNPLNPLMVVNQRLQLILRERDKARATALQQQAAAVAGQ
jgi:hypothetical protein